MNPEAQHKMDGADRIGIIIVHGVADTEQGANLGTLAETLRANSQHGFEANAYDEIHQLPETSMGSGAPKLRPVIVRHGSAAGRKVTLAEVYWADTTRVSTGKFAALIAAFRIVFEAHYFIDALIDRGAGKWRPANVLTWLLYVATGLIRWPIAAANVALLSIAAIYFYGQSILQLADTQSICSLTSSTVDPQCVVVPLNISILAMMCVLAAGSAYILVKSRAVSDIAAMEVSVWATAGITFAAVILGLSMLSDASFGTEILKNFERKDFEAKDYAWFLFYPLLILWPLFGILLISAVVVAIGMTIRASDSRTRRALWLAIALVILQASLWSLFISVPSVPLLAWGKFTGTLPSEVHDVAFGFALNYVGIVAVGLMAGIVVASRSRLVSRDASLQADPKLKKPLKEILAKQETLRCGARWMPRLIINPIILVAIVAAGLGNVGLQLVLAKYHTSLVDIFGGNLHASLAVALAVTAIALALYLVLDSKPSVNFIHIARDLIDHQFKPSLSFVHWLLPQQRSKGPSYPRRQRLLSRLESTVKFLETEGCRAIVFVAHSQGSIIVFEYLKNLPPADQRSPISRRVVTFGSPLEHLYAHYFRDYANLEAILGQLQAPAGSWTNLHRIDDPIGNAIKSPNDWLINIAMESGGHTNYWEEPAVTEIIEQSLTSLATGRNS